MEFDDEFEDLHPIQVYKLYVKLTLADGYHSLEQRLETQSTWPSSVKM